MCGIVGFFGKPEIKYRDAFEDLLHIDVLRGPHSTGVAAIERKRVDLIKGACLPSALIANRDYKAIHHHKKFCYIGHNRYATVGKINGENAHPFKVGKITGAHNGTTPIYPFPDYLKKETDSETIFNCIDKEDVEGMWQMVRGAASLVWWDAQAKTLNFLRNNERPMWWVYLPNDEGIFFASEAWMLRGVLNRRNIPFTDEKTWYPECNKLFTFKYDAGKNKISRTAKEIPPYKPEPYVYNRERWHSGSSMSSSNTNTNKCVTVNEKGQVVPFDMFKPRPILALPEGKDADGERLQGVSEADFRAYYHRCLFCNEPTLEYKTMLVVDPANAEAVCEGCQTVAALNLDTAVNLNNQASLIV